MEIIVETYHGDTVCNEFWWYLILTLISVGRSSGKSQGGEILTEVESVQGGDA